MRESRGCRGGGHEPVMVEEVLTVMQADRRLRVVDGTVGTGGHALAVLTRTERTHLLGIDRDGELLEVAERNLAPFGDRVVLRRASYADLGAVLSDAGWEDADGVLLDLGVSSCQLARGDRGFSFMHEGPLDCRFSREGGEPASALVARLSEKELGDVLYRFGEEPKARKIAKAIKETMPRTTTELARLVSGIRRAGRSRVHPATRTFQALRIAVNQELQHLEAFLGRFYRFLAPKGCAAIISYHSLEDRLVKRCFKRLQEEGIGTAVTRRPLRPSAAEQRRNRRSRGAKLRAFEVSAFSTVKEHPVP